MAQDLPSAGVLPLTLHPTDAAPSRLLAALTPGELAGDLGSALGEACGEVARHLAAEVVSVYGVEPDIDGDTLVVLANVGFQREVVGSLRLRIGEGVVGWAAECLRPVSVSETRHDPHFRAVRGLGEERLPVMLALPLARRGRLLGVLAIQRGEPRPFAGAELAMAALLAEVVACLLEAGVRRRPVAAEVSNAIALRGVAGGGGVALGRVDLLPTAEALARRGERPPTAREVDDALAALAARLVALRAELAPTPAAATGRAIDRMELFLADARFRERLLDAARARTGLATVARAYAKAPFATPGPDGPDPVALDRAADVEELCVLLQHLATGALARKDGRVWVGQRVGPFAAVAALDHAAGLVVDADGAIAGDAMTIARAGGLPLVSEVAGLCAWVRPGDLLLIDADRGVVRVNPSSNSLAEARAARRVGVAP